jgi:hypothetical protein
VAINKIEAKQLLEEELSPYRSKTYKELQSLIETRVKKETVGPSGTRYFVDIYAIWDSGKPGDLRVWGNIDSGGWRAYLPLTSDFITRQDGTFVDE